MKRARWTLVFCHLLLWLSQPAAAQQSQYDRGTPPQHAAGSSQFGSFAWADLGTVNLANGALNIQLPLGSVGGRGLSLPLTLNYSSKVWSGRIDTEDNVPPPPPDVPVEPAPPVAYAEYAEGDDVVNLSSRIAPGWTIGFAPLMKARGVPIQRIPNNTSSCGWSYGLVKLTLVLPDKGEIELRDDLTDGAPLPAQLGPDGCRNMDGNRGRRWHATDGSGMVFVSDADNGVSRGDLNGVLITAEGTRYRFSGGSTFNDLSRLIGDAVATSITDRHGNRILIDGATYTDPLGRVTRIQQNVADPDNPSVTLPFLVTLPGRAGANRYIKIKFGVMNQNYRDGINPALPVINGDWDPASYGYDNYWQGTSLFPKSYGLYASRIDDLQVVTEVVLPDGRSLRFRYNEFGEVAEVQYPTGGKAQYDYAKALGMPAGNSPLWETTTHSRDISTNVTDVDRAVTARRVFADGVNVESSWIYGYGSQTHNGVLHPCTQVTASPLGGTVLLNQRHFFLPGGRYTESPSNSGGHDGTHYSLWSTGVEWRTETLGDSGAVLAASEQDWSQRAPVAWATGYAQEQPPKDNRVNEARKILDTGAAAKVGYVYDQYNNPTEVKEYDYDQSLKRRTVTSYLDANNGYDYRTDDSIRLLRLPTLTTVFDGAGSQVSRTSVAYDEAAYPVLTYGAVSGWAAPATGARGNATTVSRWLDTTNTWLSTHAQYDQVGNVRSSWDAKGNQSQISYSDSFSDGVGRNTYAFPTATASTAPDPNNTGRGSTVPLTSSTVYDYSTGLVTSSTDANGRVTSFQYNDPLDRPTRVTRPDGGVTEYEYGDAVGDLYVKTITYRGAGQTLPVESRRYFDALGRGVRSFLYDGVGPTPWSASDTHYDALGRAWKASNPYKVSSPGAVLPDPASCTTCTTSAYDALGRVKTVTTPDGAKVETEYAGNTVKVTDPQGKKRRSVTDALGRLTEVTEAPEVTSCLDTGAGCTTGYKYDALGNLRRVEQGAQTRHFMYDSLGRLIRAKNPEQDDLAADAAFPALTDTSLGSPGNGQWSVGYLYDANGNLWKRKDARNVTTTHTYDNLNRLVQTDYSDGTPQVVRRYDFAAGGLGLYHSDETGGEVGTRNTVTEYDAGGRPTSRKTDFRLSGAWVGGFTTTRQYDLAGNVEWQVYPSGRRVDYPEFDAAGRLRRMTGNLGDGAQRTYADQITYDGAGRMREERFGTAAPLYHKLNYNARGQLYDVRLSTAGGAQGEWNWDRGRLTFYYGAPLAPHGQSNSTNNGNVARVEHWVPMDPNVAYGTGGQGPQIIYAMDYQYDALNRLESASEVKMASGAADVASYTQAYTYDRWGNRQIHAGDTQCNTVAFPECSINERLFSIDTATNRLGVPAGQAGAMQYDPAGNLTNDTYTGAGTRAYDAENRMISGVGTSQVTGTYNNQYFYDADGRRVRRKTESGEVWQVYGLDGELLAEYAANASPSAPKKEYGYRAGELLVVAEAAGATSPAPAALVAAPGGTVTLGWGAAAGAVKYRVERSADGTWASPAVFSTAGAETTYPDGTASQGAAYLYRVCAADSANNCVSAYSNAALGAARSFTDPQIVTHADHQQGINTNLPLTTIKAAHVLELREAVNSVRQLAGLAPAVWGETNLPGVFVKAAHVLELRTKLGEALAALGLPAPSYADQTLSTGAAGTLVKRGHFAELRLAATRGAGTTSAGGGGATGGVRWLVSDHLGTPRMTADQTGSLQGVRRHDYLPFGEEIWAVIGGRTTGQGYTQADNVRQKFTGYERDDETGLDYAQARYFSNVQGRFTSTDPIIITADRIVDPQQINLYHYARNNPLRWTDPTGEDIVENIDEKYKERYEKWKKAFLTTKAGKALWDKYDKDKSFTLNITVSKERGNGARADQYVFDDKGSLTGATITLGNKLGEQAPPKSLGYEITSSLGGESIKDISRAIGKFAHEFGHVEDARARPRIFQLLQEYNERVEGMNQRQIFTDPVLQRIRQDLGVTDIHVLGPDNERRAERATIPVLQEHFGKNMPKRVQKAIQDYQKAHP